MISGKEHLPKIISLVDKRYPTPEFKTSPIESPGEMKLRIRNELEPIFDIHESFLDELKVVLNDILLIIVYF